MLDGQQFRNSLSRTVSPTASALVVSALLAMLGCSRHPTSEINAAAHAAGEEGAKWVKTEIDLRVADYDDLVLVHGFWQSTSSSKERQLVFPIAVKIECHREQRVCREADAQVFMGLLEPELLEYTISTWTRTGIVADDIDEGACAIGHRLVIDFKSNSVTLTDYPMKADGTKNCKAFQDANSYALHGGQLMLYPPASWDPLQKH